MSLDNSKPVPYQLSQWDSRRQIFYRCPICGQDFRFYAELEKFCHNCGNKINWENVPKYCSEDFQKQYEDLVYNQYAYTDGDREQDKKLLNLLYKLYKGEIK